MSETIVTERVKSAHTPGPWYVEATNDGCFIKAGEVQAIAQAWIDVVQPSAEWMSNLEANSRLLAAAPELLDALIRVVHCADEGITIGPNTLAQARRSIEKARGSNE